MSGIVGIYRPSSFIEVELLESMLAAMGHRGPDARGVWSEKEIALASCLLKTTPESENETPVSSGFESRFQLVWDGRIDNREEILESLSSPESFIGDPKAVRQNSRRIRQSRSDEDSRLKHSGMTKDLLEAADPVVFLHAYERWGKDCLKHLVGEFAFALWDRKEEMLFAGRDRVGLKPFHYAWDGKNFYFSSEIKPLFKALGGMPGFDDEMILSFLSFRNFKEEDNTRTFFKKIQRLAPSHCLTLKNGELKIERYASWDLNTVLNYKNPEDYVTQFREIFEKAVQARLRSRTRITAFLSGGHDSSAIVSTAASLLKKSGDPAEKLDALNLYSDDPRCDERLYAREVAEKAGISLHALFGKTRDFLTGLGDFLYKVEAPMINISRNLEPYAFLQERGVRVVLDGEGGDQVLDEFGFGADLMARLRLTELLNKSVSFSEEFGDNPVDFLKESLLQVIPQSLQNLRRRFTGNVPARWLKSNSDFKSHALRTEARPRFQSFSQASTYFEVTRPYAIMKLELDERAWAQYGIEMRSPFFDSRLIQFMLSLPWEYRASGTRKLILKEAMKGVVPESIRTRRDKANATAETDLALRVLLDRPNPEVLRNHSGQMQKYMDFLKVENLAERYLAGEKDLRFELWFLITLDHLLQQFTQGASHDGKEEQKKEVHSAASY